MPPAGSYHHVIPFIGIFTTLAAGGDLLVFLALRPGKGPVGHRCLGADRARHAGAEAAGECGRGDGHRLGPA